MYSCIFLTNFLLYDLPQKVLNRRQCISHEPGEVSGANMKPLIDATRLLIYAQEPHISQHHLHILQTSTNGRLAAAKRTYVQTSLLWVILDQTKGIGGTQPTERTGQID